MIRDIVKYGDPVLRTKGKRLETIDDEIRILAADMLETMYEANGVGSCRTASGTGAATNGH